MELAFGVLFWTAAVISIAALAAKGIKNFKRNFIFYCKPPKMSRKARLFGYLK
jgi:hypothetical protein